MLGTNDGFHIYSYLYRGLNLLRVIGVSIAGLKCVFHRLVDYLLVEKTKKNEQKENTQ